MLVNDAAARARLESPMNLMNRLRTASTNSNPRQSAMNLFGMGRKKEAAASQIKESVDKIEEEIEEVKTTFNPFDKPQSLVLKQQIPTDNPPIEQIVENSETQVKLALAHDTALKLLNDSVSALAAKLDDVKADKLPGVITAASKVVDNIRRERLESTKLGKDKEVHYHFYTPQQKKLSDYEVIDVSAS